jgi:hypothetical protein
MTDVYEWAKREAERRYAVYASDSPRDRWEAEQNRYAFTAGAESLAALLLSDEAVGAGVMALLDAEPTQSHWKDARAVLQAALTAVTTTEGSDQ